MSVFGQTSVHIEMVSSIYFNNCLFYTYSGVGVFRISPICQISPVWLTAQSDQ